MYAVSLTSIKKHAQFALLSFSTNTNTRKKKFLEKMSKSSLNVEKTKSQNITQKSDTQS